ncbi:alpha/beta fold hydrolase [Amycolatopsis sp., V23-08]|uniref:Alpha/beta fold hydrolase n=1 Tax=Amycolatopsis heterodermiae TaxID=3110235 RepID=A0ABU5R3W5_9PSEU|nr:alpha/beta fold hydrolase [Amycolatopsis sp., V23-08]MEA5360349.1 alpha/beta fold hydrolase [Amycolatopsis sp., V23-08]
MTEAQSLWFPFVKPQEQARLRLFCFPYAGGGATVFRTWQEDLGPEVEVCAVQLPGRETRFREAPHRAMGPLADALVPVLEPLLDKPYAVAGYSMGAAVAHEVALRLTERGRPPEHFFACARTSPLLPPDFPVYEDTTDDDIWRRLRDLGGMPAATLDNPELRELVLPQLRADLELNFTYRPRSARPHDCPVTAFGGRADAGVTEEEVRAWAEVTRGPFRVRLFDGDHFFLREDGGDLLAEIRADLGAVLAHRP